jgi:hypothetical protein
MIRQGFQKMEQGEEDIFMYENKKRRGYMRAVRDQDGSLLGYYERFELLAENVQPRND